MLINRFAKRTCCVDCFGADTEKASGCDVDALGGAAVVGAVAVEGALGFASNEKLVAPDPNPKSVAGACFGGATNEKTLEIASNIKISLAK